MKSIFYYGQRVYDADEVDAEIAGLKQELLAINIDVLPEKDRQLDEKDAEITELVEMLENVLEGQSHDYPRTYLDLEIKELINKHKEG